ncbi:glycerol-3-phosphate responsive antiterminator [Clostridium brassicae]|uniref:Glycerol-3-phosphate responsive antiterminator n=1 Tax=Clostridium brassicae TaxID=2999072 RepID=A0ABT4DG15_9CLOT|nr:glycerol-3-phosphate responsive antiterminator [Clostridium brassicae]MCY6960156.1 glycerol-3-phosphate responsive antiterminator [Clostridium brassicae]
MGYLKKAFFDRIQINPIIAAVKDISKLDKAIASPCEIVFLLTGDIFNLKEIVSKVKSKGKCIFIHIDLIDGFSRNVTALKYIHENIKPDGIISTKSTLIKAAKDMNMFAIQRFFIIDSLSLNNAIESLKTIRPDAAEILPGIMGKITYTINKQTNRPVIAGGLIKDKEDVIQSIKAGAIGISTTDEKIWEM